MFYTAIECKELHYSYYPLPIVKTAIEKLEGLFRNEIFLCSDDEFHNNHFPVV